MNPFSALTINMDDSLLLVKKYHDKLNNDQSESQNKVASLRKDIQQRIDCQILQVMLYGAYNAGKSTLVNVLLGKEAAIVNDIPTTDKIDQYDWDGIHLLDTPGVNAPIEHEKTTEEQIKRTGAMLFVIREGDQDAKDVYVRLFDMLKRGKKIFIVLNHQLPNQQDIDQAISRINQILTKQASHYNIDLKDISQISIYPVNLRTAYNGRLKQSEKLQDHSGYTSFIQGFKQWVQLQDNEGRYLETLKSQISELWYNPIITFIESTMKASDNQAIKDLRDDRSMLESEQRSVKAIATNFINQQVNLLKNDVSMALQNGRSQSEVDTKLQHIFLGLPAIIEERLNNEFLRVSEKLSVVVNYKHSQQDKGESNNKLFDSFVDSTKSILSNKENLKQMLLVGRDLKIPLLKGRWERTLGRWAGRAAIVVQAATFLYDIYKANADQDRENEQQRQYSVELYQAVEQICATVINDMTTSVHEIITNVFMAKIKETQQKIDILLTENGEIKNDLNKITQLKDKMLVISW